MAEVDEQIGHMQMVLGVIDILNAHPPPSAFTEPEPGINFLGGLLLNSLQEAEY